MLAGTNRNFCLTSFPCRHFEEAMLILGMWSWALRNYVSVSSILIDQGWCLMEKRAQKSLGQIWSLFYFPHGMVFQNACQVYQHRHDFHLTVQGERDRERDRKREREKERLNEWMTTKIRSWTNQERMDSSAHVVSMGLDGNKKNPLIEIDKREGKQNRHKKQNGILIGMIVD